MSDAGRGPGGADPAGRVDAGEGSTPDPTVPSAVDPSAVDPVAVGPPAVDPVAAVAAAVLAHPGVARLDGGPFGTIASHLPGRDRVLGVRVGVGTEPVELAVVARLGEPLTRVAEELGAVVRALLGPVAVEVTVSDVVAGAPDGSAVEAPTGP